MRSKVEYRLVLFFVLLGGLFFLSSCTRFGTKTIVAQRNGSCSRVAHPSLVLHGNLLVVKGDMLYLFSAASGEACPITKLVGVAADLRVSPNGEYLIMPEFREAIFAELPEEAAFRLEQAAGYTKTHYLESLKLLNLRDKIEDTIEIPQTLRLYSLMGWFDNEWLLFEPVFGVIRQGFLAWPVVDASQSTGSVFLFNPFTGQSMHIAPYLSSDLEPDFLVLPLRWLYPFAYSPNRQRVFLYTHNDNGSKYILWSVVEQQVVWECSLNPGETSDPARWSHDGERIAYIHKGNVMILNIQGIEQKISLPYTSYVPSPMTLEWSPKDRYLSFWVEEASKPNDVMQKFQFVVYDTRREETINIFISSGGIGAIFWSPDEEQLILATNTNQYLLFDLKNRVASRFNFEYGAIIAWVK